MNISNNLARLHPSLPALVLMMLLTLAPLQAAENVKPFILAASLAGDDIAPVVASTRAKLGSAGFQIVGQYAPYPGAEIIVFTRADLRKAAIRSERGGYGATLRAAITANQGMLELAYTNPVYWANAYRMSDNLDTIAAELKTALGFQQSFGTGENSYSSDDMRDYHYTFMMEYFDDPSILAWYDNHQQAVQAVEENLAQQVSASEKVYQLDLGKDSKGQSMTVFGVGLGGENDDDCSSDAYIMGKIDKSSPRHTAHLPYEILVYGNQVEALYGRFRIAISWPHLPMMASETGATFLSIMCAPGAIENSLTRIAGGDTDKQATDK